MQRSVSKTISTKRDEREQIKANLVLGLIAVVFFLALGALIVWGIGRALETRQCPSGPDVLVGQACFEVAQ